MNYCRSCETDFGSVSAFDTHRVGKHEYTLSEGLKQDPPREDGRRCLEAREIERLDARDGTPMFERNSRGVWSLARTIKSGRVLRGVA